MPQAEAALSRAPAPAADRPASTDADAAHLLYQRHSRQIFRYCLYRLRTREEAEDAVQTTFLNALRALRRGVVPAGEAAWLLTIARNVCLSRHQAVQRRGRVEFAHDPQALEAVTAGPKREGDELIRLDDALGRLPEQQRRAFLLREWRGLSYREIADTLALSEAAVEALIFRARRSLACELRGEPAKRRRLAHGLDAGSLLGAVKSALAGGSAVKIAAAATALTSAGLLAGASLDLRPQSDRAPAAPAVERPTASPAADEARAQRALAQTERPEATGAEAARGRARAGAQVEPTAARTPPSPAEKETADRREAPPTAPQVSEDESASRPTASPEPSGSPTASDAKATTTSSEPPPEVPKLPTEPAPEPAISIPSVLDPSPLPDVPDASLPDSSSLPDAPPLAGGSLAAPDPIEPPTLDTQLP